MRESKLSARMRTALICGATLLLHILFITLGTAVSASVGGSALRAVTAKLFQATACVLPWILLRRGGFTENVEKTDKPRSVSAAVVIPLLFIALAVICAALQLNVMLCETLSAFGLHATVSGSVSLFTGTGGVLLSVLLYVLIPAVCEELFFRSALFRLFGQGGFAVIAVSLCFAFSHLNPYGLFYVFCCGLVLSLIVRYTGRICYAVLLHTAVNAIALLLSYLSYSLELADYAKAEMLIWTAVLLCGIAAALYCVIRARKSGWGAVIPAAPKTVKTAENRTGIMLAVGGYAVVCCFIYILKTLL